MKKDKEEMEKQKENDQELNRVMSQTGSVDAGELPTDLPINTTIAAAVGSAIPRKPSAGQGATASAAAKTTHTFWLVMMVILLCTYTYTYICILLKTSTW